MGEEFLLLSRAIRVECGDNDGRDSSRKNKKMAPSLIALQVHTGADEMRVTSILNAYICALNFVLFY